ncbi:uncharacterized protein F4812DRAFT_371404 [Daldinia caldariorum]|uniref:uncharacterized protein n=1 Tax=Daldinia caldariorum TaxID=326644 RepID=UPI002008446D|nr:uncharacterized protein F4812DRAFT_371404 [Daldinia caldariorum]KAI1468500.1 hypothetical protein F4812DRAFT_371404 [Daldinia caldariorum]
MGSDGETSHQPGRGLRKVFPPEGATDNTTVDIIAIHGLDTESPGTWTYKGKGRGSSVNWLEDRYMLPAAAPEARVYTYDWNAKVFNNAPVQTLLGHADSLLTLVSCEHGTSGRPILFIASCFGGLILAETICRAAQAGSNYRHILGSTIGIVFLATPFSGTGAANAASWLVVVKGIMGKDASGELIKDLVQRHEFVSERVQKFAEIANADLTRFPIRCFYETGKTKIAKKIFRWGIPDRFLRGSILVTQSSACLDGFDRRGLEKPHVMMNKFQGNDCPDFKQVKEAIQFILKEGPNTLRRRAGKEITRRSVESVMQKKQAQVLESLYFQSMNKRKNDSPDSYPETFQWIFRTDDAEDKSNDLANKRWNDFEAWLESDDAIYWISGKPGSGKTTLMKYLMGNDLTKKALAIWTERTKGVERPVIFSHLFWKAGTEELQRNIKGCLSSILYQAIELDTASLDSILTIHESLLAKKSIHDWSSKELEDVCFAMLRDYPSPACIFLDGLDEICQEDRSSLMELVENLRRLPNTKLCVASRPERDLESAFSKYPHLKLQDLTYSDMEIYASGKIEPYVSKGQITRDFGSDIIDTLVYKAKGVFLWLHLASDSLVRGLKNHDSEETLRERLEEFPDDLNKLYEDIWNRVNKNTKAYRKTAARYLNATITAQKMEKLYVYDRFSLLDLVTATNDQLQRTFRARYTIDEASLIQECKKTLGEIRTQCIGLLEIDMRMMKDNDDGPFQPYVNMSVGFAHRTAYDFLTDTEGGRAILAYDSSPHHELPFKLIKGCLITARLGLSRYHSPVHIIDELSMLPSTIPPPEIEKSLIDTWHLYDDGYFDLKYSRPHFLAIAARSRFADFIKSNIKKSKNPSSLASYVLHYVCTYSRWKVSDYLDNLNSFGEFLLHLVAYRSVAQLPV